ncbi:MAG: S41 family peptidase [Bacteroidales bacterium]
MKFCCRYIVLIVVAALLLSACKIEKDNTDKLVNKEVFNLMKEYYLWYNYLPTKVDYGAYSNPQELMDAVRYEELDRWSYVQTMEEFYQFSEGKFYGHGFSFGLDESGNIRIVYVFRNTQVANNGVQRGWIITKVNGTTATEDNIRGLLGESKAGITNTIAFLDENGAPVNLVLTKEEIQVTPVLHYEVIDQGDTKIGYLVFEEFIRPAYPEFEEAFNHFNAQGIDELIVDLRYNGGGFVNVADTLAGWLIGKDHGNQFFTETRYNNKYSQFNETSKVPAISNGVSLSRIFFIGTEYTASASELVINGISPYVDVIIAGDTTHGKPVGMDGFIVGNYVAWPVTFSYYNANNIGDFYNGLPATLPAEDDITRNFGDPEESSLKAILDYISGVAAPMKAERERGSRLSRLILPDKPISPYSKSF